MNLADCFAKVLEHWRLDIGLGQLMVFSQEDGHPGEDADPYSNTLGISTLEGRFLYALVRYFKPEHVVEIGCAAGQSATHILAALEANQKGSLTSYDIDPHCGLVIPEALRHRWTLVVEDVKAWDEDKYIACDMVFEDGDHSYEMTKRVLESVTAQVFISHDYYLHASVRDAWRDDWKKGVFLSLLFDNTSTGMGVFIDAPEA